MLYRLIRVPRRSGAQVPILIAEKIASRGRVLHTAVEEPEERGDVDQIADQNISDLRGWKASHGAGAAAPLELVVPTQKDDRPVEGMEVACSLPAAP